jgi:hypothetical protein
MTGMLGLIGTGLGHFGVDTAFHFCLKEQSEDL